MIVGPSLLHGSVIIDPNDSSNQLVVKFTNGNTHSSFLRPAYILPALLRQAVPPVPEADRADCGYAVQLHWVRIAGNVIWQFLRERKDIGLDFRRFILAKPSNAAFSFLELRFQPFLIVDDGQFYPLSSPY